MAQPENLAKLSLEAIGKYFCELCYKLVRNAAVKITNRRSKKRKHNCNTGIQSVKLICTNLHRMLTENIPITLVNEVTNKLLSCLDSLESDILNQTQEDIYEELIKSIVHPAVTRIEPEMDMLECSDIFPQNKFKNFSLVNLLLKTVDSLTNLKALNLRHSFEKFDIIDIQFPPGLEEFSGLCNDEGFVKISNSCKFLKFLNLCGLRDITNVSIATILKMEHLEKLNIAHTGITSKGITTLLNGLIQKGEALTLKCLVFSKYTPQHLRILENLPELKISLQHDYCTFFLTLDIFKISDLYSLKNLHGLEITTTLRDLNDLLREIGSQLVYLEVTIEIVDLDEHGIDADVTDILLIGQYCTSLRCLHLSGTVYGFPCMKDYTRCPLPGFQTITCLKLEVESGEKCLSDSPHNDLLYFLISQCINVKKLTVPIDVCFFSKYELIWNVIQNECMKSVEEVYFKHCCYECTFDETDDYVVSDHGRDNEVVQILVDHCPNLRIVGGVPGFSESHTHNSQRLKFITEPY